MDLALLETLKYKMATEKKIVDIWEYFMDYFGDHEEFIELGASTNDDNLIAVIAQSLGTLYQKDIVFLQTFMIGLPEHNFIHGGFTFEKRYGNFLYDTEFKVGIITIPNASPDGENKFIRFTSTELPEGTIANIMRTTPLGL